MYSKFLSLHYLHKPIYAIQAVTKLGQKITDIEVTDVILAEVLRVFMVVRNGGETEVCTNGGLPWLESKISRLHQNRL